MTHDDGHREQRDEQAGGTEQHHAGDRRESDRGEHTQDRTGTTRRAGRHAHAHDRSTVAPGAHAAAPNIDCTIGSASAGAVTSRAIPRVSTVIANAKN